MHVVTQNLKATTRCHYVHAITIKYASFFKILFNKYQTKFGTFPAVSKYHMLHGSADLL